MNISKLLLVKKITRAEIKTKCTLKPPLYQPHGPAALVIVGKIILKFEVRIVVVVPTRL